MIKWSGSFLAFNREVCATLRPANRRLFKFLSKLFWNVEVTGYLPVKHLCVHVLGFDKDLTPALCNGKLKACYKELAEKGILRLPPGGLSNACEKVAKGEFNVRFYRGPWFDKKKKAEGTLRVEHGPVNDLLRSIRGLNETNRRRVLREFSAQRIAEWVDVTLVARGRSGNGPGGSYFTTNEAAFFFNGVMSGHSPPDWYLNQKAEKQSQMSKYSQGLLKGVGLA